MRMIRTPEWKLVRHFEPEGTDELYHLSEDPGEAHNLANFTVPTTRAARDGLAQRLERWMVHIGDRSVSKPVPVPGGPGASKPTSACTGPSPAEQ